ncbi:MAG: Bax inhibitor-1/YccA family protein [Candidatus Omnitrophota bacterium]
MRTSNPALNAKVFSGLPTVMPGQAMTIQGTVHKAMILLFLLSVTATWAWSKIQDAAGLLMLGLIGGLVIGFVTIFKKDWAPVTAPLYALFEGVVLGGISRLMEAQFPGIVVQAVFLTFGTLFSLLVAYQSGLIKVTENFRLGVFAATGGICLIYVATMILGIFGIRLPYIHESGPIGIGFSLFVVVIAALNLVLDFDFIERGAESGAPKYMEWYGAFGLMVTLIWLYLEILRLLAKARSRQ